MNLTQISIILNIILGILLIFEKRKKNKIDKFEAERNYNHTRLEIEGLAQKHSEEYKKRAVELGARLDDSEKLYRRSFRGVDFYSMKELDLLSVSHENELNKKRNDLRYWSNVGNVNMFTGKEETFYNKWHYFKFYIRNKLI